MQAGWHTNRASSNKKKEAGWLPSVYLIWVDSESVGMAMDR
jgi:hypothetical protein